MRGLHFELYMLQVDSTLQHEFVRWLLTRECLDSRFFGMSVQRVILLELGHLFLSRMVKVDFSFEDESTKCTMMKKNSSRL